MTHVAPLASPSRTQRPRPLHRLAAHLLARPAALLLLAAAIATPLGCGTPSGLSKGAAIPDAATFDRLVDEAGYVVVGRFDLAFPATVIRTTPSDGSVTIDVPGRTSTNFSRLDGYGLLAVVMRKDAGGHAGAVLRTKEKK